MFEARSSWVSPERIVDGRPHRIPSVAIVGPGLVGTTTAYALLVTGAAAEIVLIGRDRNRVEGQVKDLRDAALYARATRVVAGDFAHCASADVIIVKPSQGCNTGSAPVVRTNKSMSYTTARPQIFVFWQFSATF